MQKFHFIIFFPLSFVNLLRHAIDFFQKKCYSFFMIDLHTHSQFSFDSTAPLEKMVARAAELGMAYYVALII